MKQFERVYDENKNCRSIVLILKREQLEEMAKSHFPATQVAFMFSINEDKTLKIDS